MSFSCCFNVVFILIIYNQHPISFLRMSFSLMLTQKQSCKKENKTTLNILILYNIIDFISFINM